MNSTLVAEMQFLLPSKTLKLVGCKGITGKF